MEANINEENIFYGDSDIVILNNNILSLDSDLLLDLSDKLNFKNYVDSQQKTQLINIKNIEANNNSELENLKNNNKIITELLNDTINEFNLIKTDIEYLNKTYFDIINLFIDISKKTV